MLRSAVFIATLAFAGGAAIAEPTVPADLGSNNLNNFAAQSTPPAAPIAQAQPAAPQTQATAPTPPARPVAKKAVAKKVVRPAPVQVVQVVPVAPVQGRVAYRTIQFPSVGTGF